MGRDIRYCQVCQHRKHTKMDGITCKRGLHHFCGRCGKFLEDEIARDTIIREEIAERDRLPNALSVIQCTLFVVILALMAGAYFGDYKFGHFLTYFFAVIMVGLSGAAGAWGIDKYFKHIDGRKADSNSHWMISQGLSYKKGMSREYQIMTYSLRLKAENI